MHHKTFKLGHSECSLCPLARRIAVFCGFPRHSFYHLRDRLGPVIHTAAGNAAHWGAVFRSDCLNDRLFGATCSAANERVPQVCLQLQAKVVELSAELQTSHTKLQQQSQEMLHLQAQVEASETKVQTLAKQMSIKDGVTENLQQQLQQLGSVSFSEEGGTRTEAHYIRTVRYGEDVKAEGLWKVDHSGNPSPVQELLPEVQNLQKQFHECRNRLQKSEQVCLSVCLQRTLVGQFNFFQCEVAPSVEAAA